MIVFPSFTSSNCGMLKTVRIVDDQVVYGFRIRFSIVRVDHEVLYSHVIHYE